ncbi:3Beta-HSD domain-containing protein [Mycena venus]|uniref:3Beta-HSD domain-containing protein n=1 Tax=Mycena venus TaxID=2733690 RepID=A0A8H6XLB4_9AGAR|nr:3Beta-HSD domain-containing protein [Mycena venus]
MSVPTQESYLVVGGGSGLGERIVDRLLHRGETRVSIFDVQPLATEQTQRFGPAVRVCVGDVVVPQSIADAVKSCAATCVIHVGTVSSAASAAARYPSSLTPPMLQADDEKGYAELREVHRKANTDGMRNLLAAVIESSITQLVYVGNADIIFDGHDRPMLREDEAPYPNKCVEEGLEQSSQAERMVLSFNGLNELRTAVIRPALCFGYALLRSQASELQLHYVSYKPPPQLAGFKASDNLTDRTYIDNVAHAAILAADRLAPAHPQHAATAGRAFFITNGEPRPFWDHMHALWVATTSVTPPPAPRVAGKGTMMFIARVADIVGNLRGGKTDAQTKMQFVYANRTYDISLAREVLGYAPIVSYDEGMRRVAEWWLEQQLKICKENESGVAPPPYTHDDAALVTEKSQVVKRGHKSSDQ